MADATPLKRGATGIEMFGSTDTVPRANMAAVNVISPSQITSDQDDYAPTGYGTADVIRLNFDTGFRAITGLNSTSSFDGEMKDLVNVSANYGYLPSEHPDSTAAYRWAGEIDHIIEPYGTVRIRRDGTSSRWRVVANSFNAAQLGLTGRGQYFYVPPGSTVQADHAFMGLAQASSGSNGNTAPTSTLPGAWDLDNGGNAAGASTIYISKNNNGIAFFGTSHLCCWFWGYVSALSTSSQRYTAQVSLTNNPSGTALNNNNSVGFRYSDNVNSGKWQFFSRDNSGTETSPIDTGITVAANTLYRGSLFYDKARSEARLFLTDGTNTYQGRITTSQPNAVLAGARAIMIKSVGTGTVTFNVGIGAYEIHI